MGCLPTCDFSERVAYGLGEIQQVVLIISAESLRLEWFCGRPKEASLMFRLEHFLGRRIQSGLELAGPVTLFRRSIGDAGRDAVKPAR